MSTEHSVPPPVSAKLEQPSISHILLPTSVKLDALELLAELRHVIENGCDAGTALDLVEEVEEALRQDPRGALSAPHADAPQELELEDLLDQLLLAWGPTLEQCGVVVLRRYRGVHNVLVRRRQLQNLLAELLQLASVHCGTAQDRRILRFMVRKDPLGRTVLVLEHCGLPALDWLANPVENVAIGQNALQNTLTITFL
ncbi:hypothetical protein EDM80_03020 [bacterium]|nr:MAG: hypothetical protein EDM80_03020 [bacterium]RIK65038.1 MAG: hypothetical protein DCC64_02930 [Planctomycetota bacterium]